MLRFKPTAGTRHRPARSGPGSWAVARHGLTLVELLVVIAVVLLVAILLIPSIQNARESARRTQCRNNLKQLGLALHNYHDVFSRFPPGFVLGENGVYHGWGWGVMLTPYLDASPYYSRLNFGSGLQNEYAKPNVNALYPAYRCPSDNGSKYVAHAPIVTTNVVNWLVAPATVDAANVFSRTNYFAVAGYLPAEVGGISADSSGEPVDCERPMNAGSLGNIGSPVSLEHRYCAPQNFRGLFGQNSDVKIGDITDGTSNTLMCGERDTPAIQSLSAVGHGTWVGIPDCTTTAGLAMSLGDTSLRFNSGAIDFKQTTGFGSRHGRGTHFLMADGSVKFFVDGLEMKVYRDLSTIDDWSRQHHEEGAY